MAPSNLSRLSATLLRRKEHQVPYFTSTPHSNVSPPIVYRDNVYFFPVTWRKLCLSAFRIQCSIRTNSHLEKEASVVMPKSVHYTVYQSSSINKWSFSPLLSWGDKRIIRRWWGGCVSKYTVVKECPHWYDMISYLSPTFVEGICRSNGKRGIHCIQW